MSADSTGAPRPVVNSKGRRRRPSTKSLAQVLKSDDELFVDFIAKCLIWDPERRLKPDPALRRECRACASTKLSEAENIHTITAQIRGSSAIVLDPYRRRFLPVQHDLPWRLPLAIQIQQRPRFRHLAEKFSHRPARQLHLRQLNACELSPRTPPLPPFG